MQPTRQYIFEHIADNGPCSFGNILEYATQQIHEGIQDYHVADLITELIRESKVELYDNGTSFVARGQ